MDMALLAIADPIRRSGKAPSEVVRAVILELCQGRFLRLRELSDLLDRKQESLRDNYISNLVAEGLLDLRFPGARNHPDQAYRTTQDALKDASA
jgi:ATP-dependent DNA helicase RecG